MTAGYHSTPSRSAVCQICICELLGSPKLRQNDANQASAQNGQSCRVLAGGMSSSSGECSPIASAQSSSQSLLPCCPRNWLDRRVLGSAFFHEPGVAAGGNGMVLVRDVDFASLSATSLLPFYGQAHVAYVPRQGTVLGLSKLARLTRLFAARLQSQDALGVQVRSLAGRGSVHCVVHRREGGC
jgi:hypothetical protein